MLEQAAGQSGPGRSPVRSRKGGSG